MSGKGKLNDLKIGFQRYAIVICRENTEIAKYS